jgi:iron-sulfur cluster repair protein YtfE (RIC family)
MKDYVISEYFEADHDRLDDLFRLFQQHKQTDYFRARECFEMFKYGLQRHIVWEETILFPLFEKNTGLSGGGPTFVMKSEHKQIKHLLQAIYEKLQLHDVETDDQERSLLKLLSMHNEKEESILYPAIDGVASSSDVDSVFEAMRNIPDERYEIDLVNS